MSWIKDIVSARAGRWEEFYRRRWEHDRVVRAFAAASRSGDLRRLTAVLDPGVVLRSDGGGRVTAARNPVHGADRVAAPGAAGDLVGANHRVVRHAVLPGAARHRCAVIKVISL